MIKIVTDTLSDLPQEIVDTYAITLVPLYVHFGQEVYRDRFDLGSDEFFRHLASSPTLPTTSSPSVGDFQQVYQNLLADDPAANILSIHFAGTLSGTLSSARQAVDLLRGAKIHLFDTLSGSLAQGLMVLEAARMAIKGATVDAVLSRLTNMRERMQLLLTPSTLDYLAKGGRIGRAAHLVGSLLDIKPVLRLKDGIIEPCERHRTHKRAVAAIRDLVIKDALDKSDLHLAVGHGCDEEACQWLADELCAALKPRVFLRGSIAATIGTHLGPGTVGAGWWVPA
ncbi:MAG: DegV family protein [Anaerolineae bacterium]|nr:DegV family protein [Anaerolineae bacterium]